MATRDDIAAEVEDINRRYNNRFAGARVACEALLSLRDAAIARKSSALTAWVAAGSPDSGAEASAYFAAEYETDILSDAYNAAVDRMTMDAFGRDCEIDQATGVDL